MKIFDLKTNHFENPVGYALETVTLSWKVAQAVGEHTDYVRVLIAYDALMTDVVYDSGKAFDANSIDFVPDYDFEGGKRYYWTVTVCDNTGDMAVSEVSYFEPASVEGFGATIRAPFDEHPMFIRKFEIEDEIESAQLRISSTGIYEALLNGEKVGDDYLTPFYNDYSLWIQYQTYDVTRQLKKGDNVIGVMLGNGWYKGRFGFDGELDCLYGDTLQFACVLSVKLKNGTTLEVVSDKDWLCEQSPVIASNIYDGEEFDGRKEVSDWSTENVDLCKHFLVNAVPVSKQDDEDFKGKLQPRKSPPLTTQEVFYPIEIITTPKGETVLDFGQVMTGWVEITVDEPADCKVLLQYGEILQQGNFYNGNLRTAKQRYVYISNGEKRTIRPHFTFYGFRYVKVEGVTEIKPENFKGVVIHSNIDRLGEITTSNPKINRLFLNTLWGQKGNFVDVPTDCPQRDERMGWTGDAQAFCATASFNMYTPAFFEKYLHDMELVQKTLDGAVPHVIPDAIGITNKRLGVDSGKTALSSTNASCAWADAATIIPWTIYCFYGDKSQLSRRYKNMKMWIDYVNKIDDEMCGGNRLWTVGFHFADWLALDNPEKDSSFGGTDEYYVASSFYYYSATLTAKAAKALGYSEDYQKYSRLAEEIKLAMQKEYFTQTGRIAVNTQTAMVLALHFGIVPQEHKARLVGDLKQLLDKENIHIKTGFVGTTYICLTLAENGLADYAYTLLLNEDYPSWLYEVNMGATTIWERWNSVLEDGSMNPLGMNSLNHYTYGSIVEWMYRYMCGVNPSEIEVGFKKMVIKPYLDKRLDFAKMSYNSAFGEIVSEWEIKGNTTIYSVTVPFDTTAEFILMDRGEKVYLNNSRSSQLENGGSIALTKGSYTIKVEQ